MRKQESIYNILDTMNIEAILVSNPFNMRYLSNFTGGTGYLYLSHKKSIILTDSRYTIAAEEEGIGFEVIEVNAPYEEAINDLLTKEQVKRLGFEGGSVTYNEFAKWKEKLQVEELISVEDKLTELRAIKEDWELERLKKAESIGDIAFKKILELIKPGMTELEIATELEYIMKCNGAENISFDSIVASGINSSMPHAVPSNKKIELGDFLTMDFGCIYQGYCSDMTRTIVVGKANEEQKKIYQTVLNAQLMALDALKAGVQGKEIDKIARDYIYQAGYKGCFGHGLGHSVGLEIHELPMLSYRSDAIIHANVIETVEPGIYVKGFGGVRIEDMVVVTKDGHENYAHSEKQLIEL